MDERFAMNEYFKAPIWDKSVSKKLCPDTSKIAKPVRWLKANDELVIEAPEVMYRSAHFSGTFILVEGKQLPLPKNGWCVVEVYCLWFGHRLKTRGPRFKINMSKAKVRKANGCEVVINIAQ
jgi:hypothetical protein